MTEKSAAQRAIHGTMSEGDLLSAVIDLAHVYGWTVAHFRSVLTRRGWQTPVQADGAGFPDLIMVRRETLLAVELKSETGRLEPAQEAWLQAFAVAGARTFVWKPEQFRDGSILQVLRR